MHRSIVEVSQTERRQSWAALVRVQGTGPERGVLLSACNAANGEGGWAAPGQLVVLRGENLVPHSAALGSVKVLFDGLPATVLSQSPAEILAVVPYALHGRDWVSVVVESLGQRSSAISLMMVDANPALFTVNGQGCGQAVADNGDGTPNSSANSSALTAHSRRARHCPAAPALATTSPVFITARPALNSRRNAVTGNGNSARSSAVLRILESDASTVCVSSSSRSTPNSRVK